MKPLWKRALDERALDERASARPRYLGSNLRAYLSYSTPRGDVDVWVAPEDCLDEARAAWRNGATTIIVSFDVFVWSYEVIP